MIVKSLQNLPSVNSSDAQWIAWYKTMHGEIGKKNANVLFLRAWEKRKNAGLLGSSANTKTLRDFLSKYGIDVKPDGVFAYPISAFEYAESAISTAFGIGKWSFIILALIVIIPVAMLLFNVAKNPKLLVDGMNAYTRR
jgi:hypothetical protein